MIQILYYGTDIILKHFKNPRSRNCL